MDSDVKIIERDSSAYKIQFRLNQTYSQIEDSSKYLEAKARYFVQLMGPLKFSLGPVLINLPSAKSEKGKPFQIDVFAEFEDMILVIECKSGEAHDVNRQISYISDNREGLKLALWKLTNSRKPCIFLVIYSDKLLNSLDYEKSKYSQVDIWNGLSFDQQLNIAKELKHRSKDIIFADLTAQKKLKWDKNGPTNYVCIATKSSYKDCDCYSFQIKPKALLKIAYVHRRNYSNIMYSESENITYQRMLDIGKIKSIQKFLEIPGNSFPTAIIINFEKELVFQPISEKRLVDNTGNVIPGILTFPGEYGYAWIIDGQHRLFGYSGLEKLAETHSLNVIAFSQLDQSQQANLFVEINQNQKSIAPDYLWDLYTDIYPENDEKYKFSSLVKKLGKSSKFFKNTIYIPSVAFKSSEQYSLTINNVARVLKGKVTKIYKDFLKKDIEQFYNIVEQYFCALIQDEQLRSDWALGGNGFTCSNNGFGALCEVLNRFIDFLQEKRVSLLNLPQITLRKYLDEYAGYISKAINEISFGVLLEKKKASSYAGRTKIADDILIAAGHYDENIKALTVDMLFSRIVEDRNNEFKETLAYNLKEKKADNSLFIEAILGTISAFINAGVTGSIFVGVNDKGFPVGINNEYSNTFNNNWDKLKLYFDDAIKDRVFTKGYNKALIEMIRIKTNPLVIKIQVPVSKMGVCVIKTDKQKLNGWFKLDAKKEIIEGLAEENQALYLGDRINDYNALVASTYRLFNTAKVST